MKDELLTLLYDIIFTRLWHSKYL